MSGGHEPGEPALQRAALAKHWLGFLPVRLDCFLPAGRTRRADRTCTSRTPLAGVVPGRVAAGQVGTGRIVPSGRIAASLRSTAPVLSVLLLTLTLSACTGGGSSGGAASATDSTGGTGAAAGTTGAGPTAQSRTTAARPARTTTPATVEAACPYVDRDTMAGTVGQHLDRTTVTKTVPHPGCAYYRPNGEKAVDIAVSVQPTAIAAQAKAIALGGSAAEPVNDVADGGVVAITGTGAILAISDGKTLIVIRINQRSSLEATEIARLVAAKL